MDTLYIIIPAYNEEANILKVLEDWYPVVEAHQGKNNSSRLVVIDDGSKDGTYSIMTQYKESHPLLLPITKPNSGHGATILYGYKYALEKGADYIFQTDSDGQTIPAEFNAFWEKRKQNAAVIGYRNHRKDGFSRIFVTKTLKFVLWCIFHLNITDANTPFRLMNRKVMETHIPKIPDNFNLSNVMLTVLMVNAKEKVEFVPITFRPRQGGVNSINLKKIIKIGWQAVKDFRQIKKTMKKDEVC